MATLMPWYTSDELLLSSPATPGSSVVTCATPVAELMRVLQPCRTRQLAQARLPGQQL